MKVYVVHYSTIDDVGYVDSVWSKEADAIERGEALGGDTNDYYVEDFELDTTPEVHSNESLWQPEPVTFTPGTEPIQCRCIIPGCEERRGDE